MISSNLKNYVASHMKNMEVVPIKSSLVNFAADSGFVSGGRSIQQLKDKYLSADYQPEAQSTPRADSTVNNSDDVEVALLRKKDSQADGANEGTEPRTIISSKENGLLGSQG